MHRRNNNFHRNRHWRNSFSAMAVQLLRTFILILRDARNSDCRRHRHRVLLQEEMITEFRFINDSKADGEAKKLVESGFNATLSNCQELVFRKDFGTNLIEAHYIPAYRRWKAEVLHKMSYAGYVTLYETPLFGTAETAINDAHQNI